MYRKDLGKLLHLFMRRSFSFLARTKLAASVESVSFELLKFISVLIINCIIK
jgi:hypothetical protein